MTCQTGKIVFEFRRIAFIISRMQDSRTGHVYAQFSIAYPPIMDGVAAVVQNYARRLNCPQSACITIAPKAGSWQKIDAVEGIPYVLRCPSITRLRAKPYVIPVLTPLFLFRLKNVRFDLVHIHYPVLMGSTAVRIARKRGIPVVITFHTRYREQIERSVRPRFLSNWLSWYVTRFYDKADEVWVPTLGAERILRSYGYRKDNIRVMGLGTEFTVPGAEEYKLYRSEGLRELFQEPDCDLQRNKKPPVLIYVGNLIETKNLGIILGSLRVLFEAGEDFRMVFVGDGYYRPVMERFAEDSGFADKVIFTGSVSDRERIKTLLAVSDLFLFPSVADTAGIVRIEAAAFSVPLVVVNEECSASGIVDGVNGFLSENSISDYTQTILRALSDPEKLKAAGIEAQRTLYRGWDALISEVRDRYEEIIAEYSRESCGKKR